LIEPRSKRDLGGVANAARTLDLLNHNCGYWTRSNGCRCGFRRYDNRHHFYGGSGSVTLAFNG